MIQQGQMFKLKARCADGEPLCAYRYRVAGRGSARLGGRVQHEGRSAEGASEQARLALPGGRAGTLTLGEWSLSTWTRIRVNASRSRSSAGCLGRRPPRWAKYVLWSSRRSKSSRGG